MEAKIVVVGGGVMGVSIAWYAAMRSDPGEGPVVLFEKTRLAAGSSGRSGAILRQFYSRREVAAMARDSLQVYAAFERRTGRRIGFQRTGVLTIAGPDQPEDLALVEHNLKMMVEIGIDARRVEADEIRRLSPGIAVRDGSLGAYEPGGGGVDPVATVEAFAALAREEGAITRLRTSVRSFLVERGSVVGVETDDGPVRAGTVVVAAGPWTRRLFLGACVDLPLRVVRPEQHFLAAPRGAAPARVAGGRRDGGVERFLEPADALEPAAHPVILDLEHGFYARCEAHPSREGLASPRARIGSMEISMDAEVPDPDELE